MVSETVQVSCVTNGGTESNRGRGFQRKHLRSDEQAAASCHNGSDAKGDTGTSGRDMTVNIDEDAQLDNASKKVSLSKELTFQDMYNHQDAFDDEEEEAEEDDSDWEPIEKHIEIPKWFCSNCTMVNLDFWSEASASNCSTAVGFDEGMLLHSEVGSKGAEGYCVNIPWNRGGVGAGFEAAHGDPLGCCNVTPGYAQMTHMLSALSGGKLLVILEGGYNLRSISSSATSVIKVFLGESCECEPDYIVPSIAGLHTVLEVLKIQMKYWPNLSSSFEKLQSRWGMSSVENKRNCFRASLGV